jgi:hypothetical protein
MPKRDTDNLGPVGNPTPLNFEDVKQQAGTLMGLGLKAGQVEDCILRLKKTFGWSTYRLMGEDNA